MITRDELITELHRVRDYSNTLIHNIDLGDWFRKPGNVTHVAWQVGHLAVAEYGIGIKRIATDHSNHEVPVPESYFSLFGKGSVPGDHSSTHPSPDQILSVFNTVHQTVLENLEQVSDDQLDQPTDGTHPMFTDKRGCLRWLMQHEYSHAGQLGLLRRQLGYDPLW
jgi:hypothetical protein